MSYALVAKKIALFAKHTTFLCDCFKSIKTWKTIVFGFVKHEHSIPELVEHPESKEEKIFTSHAWKNLKFLLIKYTSKDDLFSKSNSTL